MPAAKNNLQLLDLPNEMLFSILLFITEGTDYFNIRLVSRKLKDILDEKKLWAREDLHIEKFAGFGLQWGQIVQEQKLLKKIFLHGYQGIRFYILHKEHLAKLLYETMYGLECLKDKKMTLYLENTLNLCNLETVKEIKANDLDKVITQFIRVRGRLLKKGKDGKMMELFSNLYCRLRNIIPIYNRHAKFILKHPYLRNKLTQKQLLDLASICPSMAHIIILEKIPALINPINEIFFKILAASLTIPDNPQFKFYFDTISTLKNYSQLQCFSLEDVRSQLESVPALLNNLIKEAEVDERFAVLLFLFPPCNLRLSSETIVDLLLKHTKCAEFALKHLAFKDKLTQKQLLDVASIHPKVAEVIIRGDLFALTNPINETFFKILAVSLIHEDYPLPERHNGVVSRWVEFLRDKYFLLEFTQSKLRNDSTLFRAVMNEARRDARLAVLLLISPSLTRLLPSEVIVEYFLNDIQAKERHWVRQYFLKYGPSAMLLKYSVETPMILWNLSGLARFILFDANLSQYVIPKIKTVGRVDASQIIVNTISEWSQGFSLYPTHFELDNGTRFTLYLNQKQYESIYAKFHPVQPPLYSTQTINLSEPRLAKSEVFVSHEEAPTSEASSLLPQRILTQPKKPWYQLMSVHSIMLIFGTLSLLSMGAFCLAMVVYPLGPITFKLLAGVALFCGVMMGMMTYSALKMDFAASNKLSHTGSVVSDDAHSSRSNSTHLKQSIYSGGYTSIVETQSSISSPLPSHTLSNFSSSSTQDQANNFKLDF